MSGSMNDYVGDVWASEEWRSHVEDSIRTGAFEMATATSELKRRIRDIYKMPPSEMNLKLRTQLTDDKIILLCRGYEFKLGPRGGAT